MRIFNIIKNVVLGIIAAIWSLSLPIDIFNYMYLKVIWFIGMTLAVVAILHCIDEYLIKRKARKRRGWNK